jgi:hypothetical protein
MDQLKVVLAYKFWILGVIAVLVPPVGWWLGTGTLAEEYTKDEKVIQQDKETVKTLTKDTNYANTHWIDSAKSINRKAGLLVEESHQKLYDHQRGVMKWHPMIQEQLTGSKAKYRGDVPVNLRRIYAFYYDPEWQAVRNIIEPFNLNTGDGKIVIASEQDLATNTASTTGSTIRRAPVSEWKNSMPPAAAQMWDEQEDLWLLRCVFDAIKKVNEGSTDIGNSRIKRLDEITLRGGSLIDLAARKSGTATSQQTQAAPPAGGLHLGGQQSTAKSPYHAPAPFDPDDVFGADGSNSGNVSDKGSGRAPSAKNQGAIERYVDLSPGKWRSRGFVLQVVMDEREILSLLGELSDSPFPVEIRHVENLHFDSNTVVGLNLTQSGHAIGAAASGAVGSETEAQQKALQRLRSALNQNYLATVTVTGTFTIYDEPAKKDGSSSPKPPAASLASVNGGTKANGPPSGPTPNVKGAPIKPAGIPPAVNGKAATATAPSKGAAGNGPAETQKKPSAGASAGSSKSVKAPAETEKPKSASSKIVGPKAAG